jgi:uncharacterized membrane protein (DUF4010 family)
MYSHPAVPSLDPDSPAVRLAVAALIGLTVGLEREWSIRSRGLDVRFAGVRTFVLVGLIGGLAAELTRIGAPGAAVVLMASAASIAAISYAAAVRRGETDGTTEIASLVVLAAGALAGAGDVVIASAVGAVTALLLLAKQKIHGLIDRIRSEEIEGGIRFAVLAVVVLPLLPEGPFGPEPGFRPRELWALVLLFAGLSFLGHIALRAAGPQRGYGISGLLGGLVSSTLATLTLSRQSRETPSLAQALALGTVAACTVTPARVLVLSAAIGPNIALPAVRYLGPALLASAVAALLLLRLRGSQKGEKVETEPISHPLRLRIAIQMAVGFQLVLYLVHWVTGRLGEMGTLGSAALVGATDVDALVYTMVRLGGSSLTPEVAAKALGIGVLSNTILKLGIAAIVGKGRYRVLAPAGLLFQAAVLGAALLLF